MNNKFEDFKLFLISDHSSNFFYKSFLREANNSKPHNDGFSETAYMQATKEMSELANCTDNVVEVFLINTQFKS